MIVVQKTRVGVNMGDHAQDITEAHEVAPGETVEHLVERLLSRDVWKSLDLRTVQEPDHESYLVIRIAVPADTDEGKDSITFNTDDLGPATDIDGNPLADTDEGNESNG